MKLEPLYDRVIIKRIEDATGKTAGGIIIPDMAKEKPSEGIVMAVGEGKYQDGVFRQLSVKEGDRVLFGKYSGVEITFENETLLIVREDEIQGRICE